MGETTLEELGFECVGEYKIDDTLGNCIEYRSNFGDKKDLYGEWDLKVRIVFLLEHKAYFLEDYNIPEEPLPVYIGTEIHCAITNKMKEMGWI